MKLVIGLRALFISFFCLTFVSCGGGPAPTPSPAQPAPDFTLAITPASLSMAVGAAHQIQITRTALNGFTGTVSVNATSFPPGVTFFPALPLQVGSSAMTLSVTAGTSVPTGNYKATFVAQSGSLRHAADIDLSVGSRACLSLVVPTQVLRLPQSGSSSAPITINSDAGIIDFDVELTASTSAGVVATFSHSAVAPNTTVLLDVAAMPSAPIGPAVVTIQATRSVDGLQSSADVPIYIDPDPARVIGGTITEYALPASAAAPSAISQGPDLAMWFGEEAANQLGRIDINGSISEWPLPTANAGPGGIAAGADGNIYFTESRANKIAKYDLAYARFSEWNAPLPGAGPAGIVSALDGTLWILAPNVDTLFHLTTQGVFLPNVTLSSGCFPHGPTIGSDGNLWFACIFTDQIVRVTPQATITYFALPVTGSKPTILTNGADGNIYFTEQVGRIGEFNLTTLAFTNGRYRPSMPCLMALQLCSTTFVSRNAPQAR